MQLKGARKKYKEENPVEHDLGITVIDELNGMAVGGLAVWIAEQWGIIQLLSGFYVFTVFFIVFAVFRVFDIVKPLGISVLERKLKNIAENKSDHEDEYYTSANFWHAASIMLDDTLGGLYTIPVCLFIFYFLPL